jgi:hypothetical protein
MHMITSQAIANVPIPNFLNEKLCKMNSLKRKNDFTNNDMNDFNNNKYQKTSISSSLSPSSTSSTLSLTTGESNGNKMNNLEPPVSNQMLELVFKNINKKPISEDCKENRCNAIENQHQSVNSETVITRDKTLTSQPSYINPFSQPLASFAAKQSNTETSNYATNISQLDDKLNLTSDQNNFPQNKYKKFLSNFNQQKKLNNISHNESLDHRLDVTNNQVKERSYNQQIETEKSNEQINQDNKKPLQNEK